MKASRLQIFIKPQHKSQYIESLDSLRGFAVMAVLFFHGSYGIFAGGWIGVDLFFVLSGYLITSLLQNEYGATRNISLSKFYARRALRLLPPLIITVIVANILWPFTKLPHGGDQLLATLGSIFYSTNLIADHLSGNMSHLWSLSVEEHFYFIWPIAVLFFLFRISLHKRIVFLIVMIVALAIFRIFVFNFIDFSSYWIFVIDSYQFTLCRIDSILMGALLFFITSKPQFNEKFEKGPNGPLPVEILLGAFLLIMLTLNVRNAYWHNGGFILTNLLCALTVWMAIKNPHHYLFSNKIFRWIGRRSYGIYVYHFPVFLAFETFRIHHSLNNFLIVTLLRFAVSLALAALSYEYIEQPLLGFKKRFKVQEPDPVHHKPMPSK